MNIRSRVFLLSLTLCTLSGPLAAADGGEVVLRESQWRAVDTVAFREGRELRVAVSDVPFDLDAMRSDGRLNIFDVLRHRGQTLTLSFGEPTPSGCFDFSVRAGDVEHSGSQCDATLAESFSDVDIDSARASGSVDWRKGDERIVLRWSVPISAVE